jgi:formate/nitrite transporter
MMSDKRMLVIDDESVVLSSCRRIFGAEGFEVVTTESPRQGLELASGSRFDVILCDWRMPELNGLDVVEMLDKRAPDAAVVMITGFPSVDRATEVMKRGAMDFVAKPFTPEEITSAVQKALKRKAAEAGKRAPQAFPLPSLEDQAPKTIAETVAQKVGVGKVTSPWLSVLVLGLLAGAYIGFGGMLATTLSFEPGVLGLSFSRFMAGVAFSLGLMLVVIAGAELFTGNNLMISSALAGQIGFGRMALRWALVYAANFAGALLLALLYFLTGLWKLADGALGAAIVRTAYTKVNLSFLEALARGILCNWLVCLAVWMALASRQIIGKIFSIFFPIMAFIALGFEHSVANMYLIPEGLLLKAWRGISGPASFAPESLSWGRFLLRNLLPVTIGNIIGGAVFVGMSYWSAYLRPAEGKKK